AAARAALVGGQVAEAKALAADLDAQAAKPGGDLPVAAAARRALWDAARRRWQDEYGAHCMRYQALAAEHGDAAVALVPQPTAQLPHLADVAPACCGAAEALAPDDVLMQQLAALAAVTDSLDNDGRAAMTRAQQAVAGLTDLADGGAAP